MKIGLDIGGTKCAVSAGECEGGAIKILSREEFPTAGLSWQQVLEEFAARIEAIAFQATVPRSPFPVPISLFPVPRSPFPVPHPSGYSVS